MDNDTFKQRAADLPDDAVLVDLLCLQRLHASATQMGVAGLVARKLLDVVEDILNDGA